MNTSTVDRQIEKWNRRWHTYAEAFPQWVRPLKPLKGPVEDGLQLDFKTLHALAIIIKPEFFIPQKRWIALNKRPQVQAIIDQWAESTLQLVRKNPILRRDRIGAAYVDKCLRQNIYKYFYSWKKAPILVDDED